MKQKPDAIDVSFALENISALSVAWRDFREDKADIELLLIKHAKQLVEILEARQQHLAA